MIDGTGAVLFDFNGVIVDDEEQHRLAFQDVLAESGIPLTRQQYYAHYLGCDDFACFVAAFQRAGKALTPAATERLIAEKSRRYERLIDASLVLVPGAKAFVERAAEELRLGLVSGALRHEIDHVLHRVGLRDCFEVVVAAEDVDACKPNPAGYLAARAALDRRAPISARQCVVVEDSLPGLAAARAAGMRCAMLSTSHDPALLSEADAVWPSFQGHEPAELVSLLTT